MGLGEGRMNPAPKPKRDWARHSIRVLSVIDNLVRSLGKRQLIQGYVNQFDSHNGAYWGIRSQIADYGHVDVLPSPAGKILELATTTTRLKRLSDSHRKRLINWDYTICDPHFEHILSNL